MSGVIYRCGWRFVSYLPYGYRSRTRLFRGYWSMAVVITLQYPAAGSLILAYQTPNGCRTRPAQAGFFFNRLSAGAIPGGSPYVYPVVVPRGEKSRYPYGRTRKYPHVPVCGRTRPYKGVQGRTSVPVPYPTRAYWRAVQRRTRAYRNK